MNNNITELSEENAKLTKQVADLNADLEMIGARDVRIISLLQALDTDKITQVLDCQMYMRGIRRDFEDRINDHMRANEICEGV